MKAKRSKKTDLRGTRRARAARRYASSYGTAKPQGPAVYDLEDLLICMLVGGKSAESNGTDIENLIYSTTGSTAELGYDFGFSVGRSMAFKLGNESGISSVLDRIGLKDSLYNPFSDEVVITSGRRRGTQPTPSNRCIHIYESGVIAGYLSASTGVRINALEKRCTHNGSAECQFSAASRPKPSFDAMGVPAAVSGIAAALASRKFTRLDDEYNRILACVPLLDSRLSWQVTKMMFMAGESLGRTGIPAREAIENVANYFGARVEAEARGRKSIIRLRFESYNSVRAFVAMPAAIIAGLYTARGMPARADFRTNSDSTYTAVIEATRKI